MNLIEAKQILKANGYSLLKEMYDPPVDPPEGPDLPLEQWENDGKEEAVDLVASDIQYLEKNLKEKYPEVNILTHDIKAKSDYDYFDYDGDYEYSKEYECVIEIDVPVDVLGLNAEEAIGEKYPTGVYGLSDSADKALDNFWAENYDSNSTDIAYTDFYDSYFDEENNTCVLQMSGIFTYKKSNN